MPAQEIWNKKVRFPICYEGYGPKNMSQVLPLISRLGFIRVAAHLEFCEKSGGLRDNTIYFICAFQTHQYDPKRLLRSKRRQIMVDSPMLREGTRRLKRVKPELISANILFLSDKQVVGWYNKPRNILWLPDLMHHGCKGEGFDALMRVLGEVAAC